MKKFFLLILLLCIILCGCGKKKQDSLSVIQNRGKIIVGVREDAFPFGFKNPQGEFDGFDIDLAKYIAKIILGSESAVEFVPVTAQNRIMKLNSGEVDMLIALMSITNHRQQVLDFSYPYYVAGQAILVNNSSKLYGLGDFKGKKIIIVFGSTGEQNLRTNVPNVEILGYKTYDLAFNALKSGIADGIIADDTILLGYAIKDSSVRLFPKRYSREPYAIAFRKEPESYRLLKKINYIIDDMSSKGKLNRLRDKWNVNR